MCIERTPSKKLAFYKIKIHSRKAMLMINKKWSGLLGIVVGGIWFVHNLQHFSEQGFVAIGMPLLIAVVGVIYFIRGQKQ